MTEQRYEYSDQLWITTGVPGNDQESNFMNATLQTFGDLEFSVAVHVGMPGNISSQDELRDYLSELFGEAIRHTNKHFGPNPLNVEILIGPAGNGGEEEP